MVAISLFSSTTCSLCVPVKYVVGRVAARMKIPFLVIDITKTNDSEVVAARFHERIPVVTLTKRVDVEGKIYTPDEDTILFEPKPGKVSISESEFESLLRSHCQAQ